MTDAVKKEIDRLKAEVRYHQHQYYDLDDPVISDSEYDIMFRKLEDLEAKYPQYATADSPTKRVGGEASAEFKQIKHQIPMLSLANSLDADEANTWVKSVEAALGKKARDIFANAEPKYDGLSSSIIYEYGKLKQAVTRGDGEVGEDITANMKMVNQVPHEIPQLKGVKRFEVRGEVLMLKASFKALNEKQAKVGGKLFANCRNAAAGALRNSDPKVTKERSVHFFAYSLGACSEEFDAFLKDHQSEMIDVFRSFGFTASDLIKRIKLSEIADYYENMAKLRPTLPFEIDGNVIKVDDLNDQDTIGWKWRTPKWATAWKFPPDEAQTILEAIDIQVGRTGAQTPVARLKPVACGGVTVTNVTLHNADEIARKDIRVGDTVIVVRNGDVIPGIKGVVFDKRPENSVPFKMPCVCPSCGGPTVKEEDYAVTVCHAGLKCPAQRLGAISHYVSRKAMDIDGCGDSTIQALLTANLIEMPSDLYALTEAQVMTLEGFGKRSAQMLVKSIAAVKEPELRRFIFSLGIPNTGEGTSKKLAAHFGSFDNLLAADKAEILSVEDVGPTTANSVYGYLHDPVTGSEAQKLASILKPKEVVKIDLGGSKLGGKTFLVTGTLSVPRDKIHELIEANGGVIASSVNKKLNYLIAGDAAGSKLTKAEAAGVPVLTEEEFRAMIA